MLLETEASDMHSVFAELSGGVRCYLLAQLINMSPTKKRDPPLPISSNPDPQPNLRHSSHKASTQFSSNPAKSQSHLNFSFSITNHPFDDIPLLFFWIGAKPCNNAHCNCNIQICSLHKMQQTVHASLYGKFYIAFFSCCDCGLESLDSQFSVIKEVWMNSAKFVIEKRSRTYWDWKIVKFLPSLLWFMFIFFISTWAGFHFWCETVLKCSSWMLEQCTFPLQRSSRQHGQPKWAQSCDYHEGSKSRSPLVMIWAQTPEVMNEAACPLSWKLFQTTQNLQ